jgi:hypothetical protein
VSIEALGALKTLASAARVDRSRAITPSTSGLGARVHDPSSAPMNSAELIGRENIG